jgi:hypothetical protein
MTRGNRQYLWAVIMIVLAAMTVLPYRTLAQDDGGGGAGPLILGLPDLVIESVSVTNTAGVGTQIAISDVTSNQTTGASRTSFYDYIYLTTDTNNLTANNLVATHLITSLMGANASVPWAGTITIPYGTPLGTNYISDVADGTGIVKETNPNNNTNSVMIIITP